MGSHEVLHHIIYVRPLLEFSSPVWSPISSSNINKLENVQRYFTNRIRGCTYRPYYQRLSMLSLNSLQHRRTVSDLSTLHLIASGRYNIILSPHLLHMPPSFTRDHNLKIIIPIVRYSASKQKKLSRRGPFWNSLPSSYFNSTPASFRFKIVKLVKDPFLCPPAIL